MEAQAHSLRELREFGGIQLLAQTRPAHQDYAHRTVFAGRRVQQRLQLLEQGWRQILCLIDEQ